MNKKRILSWICALAIALTTVTVPAQKTLAEDLEPAKSSDDWSTYYSSGSGATGSTDKLSLTTWGSWYVASCTSITGSCTSITVKILAYDKITGGDSVPMSNTVAFSRVASTSFKLTSLPEGEYTYFQVSMSCSGGTTAYTKGTIKMNGY